MKLSIHKKLFALSLSFLIVIMILPSCKKDDGAGYIFRTNIVDNPKNLDPQMAADSSSKSIIMNLYQGLVRIGSDGAIENAAAKSYSLSDDNLTYTFKLKDNIYWESVSDFSAKLTAHDFVFAFERILKNGSSSPYTDEFSCIKNAIAVSRGYTDISNLGVKALDDFTLVFELEYPYYNFLELLTHTSALPCSKEFFEATKGRYGLSAETSASNYAFYLKEWNFDPYWDNNYLILRRNVQNNEVDMVYPYSVNYFITGDKSIDISKFEGEKVDCIILDNYNKKLLKNSNFISYKSKSYGLIFNSNSDYFSKKELRNALSLSLNRDALKNKIPENLSVAYGIVPEAVTVMGKSYRNLVPENSMSELNIESAVDIWQGAMAKYNINSIDSVKITIPDSFDGSSLLNIITEEWQKSFDFFCGIEVVSENEYYSKLTSGNFEIALVELDADYNDAKLFLQAFSMSDANSIINPNNQRNMHLESVLARLKTADKLSTAVDIYSEAEKLIISDSIYIPLFYGYEYLVFDKDAADLIYYPFSKQILFKDAKMY